MGISKQIKKLESLEDKLQAEIKEEKKNRTIRNLKVAFYTIKLTFPIVAAASFFSVASKIFYDELPIVLDKTVKYKEFSFDYDCGEISIKEDYKRQNWYDLRIDNKTKIELETGFQKIDNDSYCRQVYSIERDEFSEELYNAVLEEDYEKIIAFYDTKREEIVTGVSLVEDTNYYLKANFSKEDLDDKIEYYESEKDNAKTGKWILALTIIMGVFCHNMSEFSYKESVQKANLEYNPQRLVNLKKELQEIKCKKKFLKG